MEVEIEIFSNQLYPGDTRSDTVFKRMLGKFETVLTLDSVEKRSWVRLRFDAGALFKQYGILLLMDKM